MQRFFNWLSNRITPERKPPAARAWHTTVPTGYRLPERKLDAVQPREYSSEAMGTIEDGGPGKNVFVRHRYVREDTGTHETLKIISSTVTDQDDDAGIDPYNTGQFDRARTWDSYRSRK